MIIQRFTYKELQRKQTEQGRLYETPDGNRVSSVTTILDRTKPEEDKRGLQEWRNRIGHKKASQITQEAANVGTVMHKFLEDFSLNNELSVPGSNLIQKQAHKMAEQIVNNGLSRMDECWGVEVPVYYPELYAGTTDCVGVFEGEPAIIDFKQSNKKKKPEWVHDYYLQLGAYALAHNAVHGTNIQKGVILMCTRNFEYQEFTIKGAEFDYYTNLWLERVAKFYEV